MLPDPFTRLPFPTPSPTPLTPLQPTALPFQSPQPQPLPDTAEQCQVVRRRRRKKGRCREGFFRETATETKFITWRSRSCRPTVGRVRNVFTTV